MKILGIGHYSRTGKDTLANMIIERNVDQGCPLVVKRINLAWKLKEIAFDLYQWAGMQPPQYYDTEEGAPYRDYPLVALGMTPVEVWVALGTPAIRDQVYDRTWIDYILKTDHGCDLLIVPDVRFPNEVKAFKEEGAMLIKTVREGYGPRATVADEALVGYDGWDLICGPTMEALEVQSVHLYDWADDQDFFPTQSPAERSSLLSLENVPC